MISVVVGQKGLVTTQGGTNWKSGGGGASWVYSGTTPYLIAGGGGGAGENSTRSNATFTANFNSGYTYWGTTQKQINANAGTGGQAGTLTVVYCMLPVQVEADGILMELNLQLTVRVYIITADADVPDYLSVVKQVILVQTEDLVAVLQV